MYLIRIRSHRLYGYSQTLELDESEASFDVENPNESNRTKSGVS